MLIKITNNIFAIKIPFEEITTTVYVVNLDRGCAIIDSGTYESDVVEYIIPEISAIGIKKNDVKYLLLTHSHGDHSGGIKRLAQEFPHAIVSAFKHLDIPHFSVLCDGDILLDFLLVIHLPGHSEDSAGFFELKSRTLLSGDCLQLGGVGKYIHGIQDKNKYIESMRKLQSMHIEKIVAAHDYVPLGCVAEGKMMVSMYIETCIKMC